MSTRGISPYPRLHRAAFQWASAGWRGSSFVWVAADALACRPAGLALRPDGILLHVNSSDWTARTAYEGTYERILVKVLRHLLEPGDAVIDVGANIGFISSVAAKTIETHGLIIQVEPSDYCLKVLDELNPHLASSTSVVAAAAGAEDASVILSGHDNPAHRGLGTVSSRGTNPGQGLQQVNQITLDSLVDVVGSRSLGLLKVDVEGYEDHVLSGSRLLIEALEPRHLVLEVSPNFGDVSWVQDFIDNLAPLYVAHALEEKGTIRRRPALVPVSGQMAVRRTEQWNLLMSLRTATLPWGPRRRAYRSSRY